MCILPDVSARLGGEAVRVKPAVDGVHRFPRAWQVRVNFDNRMPPGAHPAFQNKGRAVEFLRVAAVADRLFKNCTVKIAQVMFDLLVAEDIATPDDELVGLAIQDDLHPLSVVQNNRGKAPTHYDKDEALNLALKQVKEACAQENGAKGDRHNSHQDREMIDNKLFGSIAVNLLVALLQPHNGQKRAHLSAPSVSFVKPPERPPEHALPSASLPALPPCDQRGRSQRP